MLTSEFRYELIRNGKAGRLLHGADYMTPITGHKAVIQDFVDGFWVSARLCHDGRLVCKAGTEWDFGTMAADTPPMVRASLAHDMLCHMTNMRLIPWECRHQADKYLNAVLKQFGASYSRFWRVPGVVLYSQLLARWKDKSKP
jgi:hypothetical protein